MVNRNYIRGRAAEYRAKKELEADDFFVIRSAGSHSYADLIAVDINVTRLIQVKATTKGKNYMDDNLRALIALPVHDNCRKELWILTKKGFQKDSL